MNHYVLIAAARIAIVPALAHDGHDHQHAAAPQADPQHSVTTGNGMHTYRTVPGWGALPDNQQLGPTHGGVAVDRNDRVYVSTQSTKASSPRLMASPTTREGTSTSKTGTRAVA